MNEAQSVHTRLLRATLLVDESRAWWAHRDPSAPSPSSNEVFEGWWLGSKSHARTQTIVTNLRARFDAWPSALGVLHRWRSMEPEVRALICHWHVQLSDPTYRAFTGAWLPDRRETRADVSLEPVIQWIASMDTGRWTTPTHVQFASKLLSTANDAGLVRGTRDPRALVVPPVPDLALGYLLHLLRDAGIPVLDNPYLRSVDLSGATLDDRLRRLPWLAYRRTGDVAEFGWRYPDLTAWADAAGLT